MTDPTGQCSTRRPCSRRSTTRPALTWWPTAYVARLQAEAPSLGLSLGDRCCLAVVAVLPGAYALTADSAWADLPDHLDIDVRLVRG